MNETKRRISLSASQWNLIYLILAVSTASLLYSLIVQRRLEQTSVLFVGIPAILSILVALTSKAKSVTGGIMKGITVMILLSGPLLHEGFICIVMASPLFYLVGLIVGVTLDRSRRKRQTTLSCLVLILLPMSLEGSVPNLSFNREETVRVSRIVDASDQEVELALSHSPRTNLSLPLYGRMGFPRPKAAHGDGLAVGDTRIIHFAGGEGHPGDLLLRIQESRPGYVRFVTVSDGSKIAHWLDWKSSETEWSAVDAHHTQVTWTLHFERRLDPAWYFGPWERYAVRLAADYLIRANGTPQRQGE
jgi:hypothetical protein